MNALTFNSKNTTATSIAHLFTAAIKSVNPLIWLNLLLITLLALVSIAVS